SPCIAPGSALKLTSLSTLTPPKRKCISCKVSREAIAFYSLYSLSCVGKSNRVERGLGRGRGHDGRRLRIGWEIVNDSGVNLTVRCLGGLMAFGSALVGL